MLITRMAAFEESRYRALQPGQGQQKLAQLENERSGARAGNITLAAGPTPGPRDVTGRADGSSPDKPIRVTGSEAVRVLTPDEIIKGVKPEAFVVAVRGTIGLQQIPGLHGILNRIPQFRGLDENVQMGYLVAALTPVDVWTDGGFQPSALLDGTLFLSLRIPGRQQLVVTIKPKDLNFEAGRPIYNWPPPGGDPHPPFIFFSNERAGVTLKEGLDGVVSGNTGILRRVGNIGRATQAARTIVTRVMRAIEAGEAAVAVAGAPEMGGGALVAGAVGIAVKQKACAAQYFDPWIKQTYMPVWPGELLPAREFVLMAM